MIEEITSTAYIIKVTDFFFFSVNSLGLTSVKCISLDLGKKSEMLPRCGLNKRERKKNSPESGENC